MNDSDYKDNGMASSRRDFLPKKHLQKLQDEVNHSVTSEDSGVEKESKRVQFTFTKGKNIEHLNHLIPKQIDKIKFVTSNREEKGVFDVRLRLASREQQIERQSKYTKKREEHIEQAIEESSASATKNNFFSSYQKTLKNYDKVLKEK